MILGHRWRAAVGVLVMLGALLGAQVARAQPVPSVDRYTLTQIVDLLQRRVTAARVLTLVSKSRCVEWTGAGSEEAAIRRAGAPGDVDGLLAVLRNWPKCGTTHPASSASAAGTPRALGEGFGDEQFARIPAGSFVMGTERGGTDERPSHQVMISRDFLLQRTEVTQGQWRAVMGTAPSSFSNCGDTCPVESISWDDAQAFIRRLNTQDPGKQYRLPTEAEWEYAARAGSEGEYGAVTDLDAVGWYDGNSDRRPHRVAQKRPNGRGLHDMHGNVGEWVQDWYAADHYRTSTAADPSGPSFGTYRVLRGGSWAFSANNSRSSYRDVGSPDYRSNFNGFRLARTP